jgi:hypothetical protein
VLRFASSAAVAGMLALGACAAALPSAPSVIGLPPAGKDLSQFQQEDASCRAYASQQLGGSAGSSYALQQRYDIAYTQCMYSKGDTVSPAALVTGVSYPGYRRTTVPFLGARSSGSGAVAAEVITKCTAPGAASAAMGASRAPADGTEQARAAESQNSSGDLVTLVSGCSQRRDPLTVTGRRRLVGRWQIAADTLA